MTDLDNSLPEDLVHHYEGEPDEDLINFLEPDQLVADTSRPLPRAQLSRRAHAALWMLRVFVIVLAVLVIYVFISQTVKGHS